MRTDWCFDEKEASAALGVAFGAQHHELVAPQWVDGVRDLDAIRRQVLTSSSLQP